MVSWKNIKAHQSELDSLFCNFEKDRLKEIAPEILIEKIRELKCYSPYTTKNQMAFLKNNIETFERIEQKYDSLDNFITHSTPAKIVKILADSNSNYKLKYAGVALVCEYLRNVGIVHIKRIVSSNRLNLIQSKSDYKIIEEFRQLSTKTGISQVKMDYLLWNYCSKGYGEICTAKPKCEKCVIKNYCSIGGQDNFNQILDLKFDDKIISKSISESDKMALLKQEFKNYLIKKYPNVSNVTINTYLSDSFYVYRHNHEFSIDFWDLFKDKQNIENFSNEIISQQTNINRIEKPKESAKAYINGLNRLYNFFNEKYDGVEDFMNS